MNDRRVWLSTLERLSRPVLEEASKGLLHYYAWEGAGQNRREFAPLECLARLLSGIAPWLAGGGGDAQEQRLRDELGRLARKSIVLATTPDALTAMNFDQGGQPLVDTAFLVQALIRGRSALWDPLSEAEKMHVIEATKKSRKILPWPNNWVLFSAMVEAFMYMAGEADWDRMRIDASLRTFETYYLGDGMYGDGAAYHDDYYNSYVIQPFLLDILYTVQGVYQAWDTFLPKVEARARRYAERLERVIGVDGSFPATGRSLCYRAGAMQGLAERGWRGDLPKNVSHGQVRAALTQVIKRTLAPEEAFKEDGFLRIGLVGEQPELAESYINTGSLYLTSTVLLPLGLPPEASFWSDEAEPWTARRVWSGEGLVKRDQAYDEHDHHSI